LNIITESYLAQVQSAELDCFRSNKRYFKLLYFSEIAHLLCIIMSMIDQCFRVKSTFLIEFLKPTQHKNQCMQLQQSQLLKVMLDFTFSIKYSADKEITALQVVFIK